LTSALAKGWNAVPRTAVSQAIGDEWINTRRALALRVLQWVNRTTDTRIFSRAEDCFWLDISISYRGVRCPVCRTMQDFAQLIHAKLTREIANVSTCFNSP
jgi:hypothetical protein